MHLNHTNMLLEVKNKFSIPIFSIRFKMCNVYNTIIVFKTEILFVNNDKTYQNIML